MKTWIFSLTSIALISSGIFSVIFLNTDPSSGGEIVVFGFFFTMLVAIASILTLLGIIYYTKVIKTRNRATIVNILRRSFLIALISVGLFLFSALNVLNFLSAFNFVLALVLLEIFFISRKKESKGEN